MANALFDSLMDACRMGGHVVYRENDNGEGRFERAGACHAVATFFGSESAKELNKATLAKIKEVLSAERTEKSVNNLRVDTFDGKYFADARSVKIHDFGSKRVESSAIARIVAGFRDEVSGSPDVQKAVRDASMNRFLDGSGELSYLQACAGDDGDVRSVAERIIGFMVDDELARNPIKNYEDLESLRGSLPTNVISRFSGIARYLLQNQANDADVFGRLFKTLDAFDRENGTDRLGRFMTSFAEFAESEKFDTVSISLFMATMDHEKGMEFLTRDDVSFSRLTEAFKTISKCGLRPLSDSYFAAFELGLSFGGRFGDFGQTDVLIGLASVFPEVASEDVENFISVMADLVRNNPGAGSSSESVANNARAVNETLALLRVRAGAHPDAVKDGVQLMKDLHAPIDAETMGRLLRMAETALGDIVDAEKSFTEYMDRNLASICLEGGGIRSEVAKNEKDWIVAKFILSSMAKLRCEFRESVSDVARFPQQVCGSYMLSSSARNLKAFYARAGGPLCAQYARALEFLIDLYWEGGNGVWYQVDSANAFNVSKAVREKYGMDERTGTKPDAYRIRAEDYKEFEGGGMARAVVAVKWIEESIAGRRMFDGDKVRVKQLALQHIAHFHQENKGMFPDEVVVRRIANRYCRLAQWGGNLLDRIEKEVPVIYRKAVILALEAYDCSSDEKLFEMITKDRDTLVRLKMYIDECAETDARHNAPEGMSVTAWDIHMILTGEVGSQSDLDMLRNPHLSVIYSYQG